MNQQSFILYAFAGALSNLSKIDFSFLNLYFVKIKSKRFKDFLRKYSKENFTETLSTINDLIINKFWDADNLYILLPIDINKQIKEENVSEINRVLLIPFPSNFTLYAELMFEWHENKLVQEWFSTYNFQISDDPNESIWEDHLVFYPRFLPDINKFIKLYFERIEGLTYLHTAISSYEEGFSYGVSYTVQYLLFCIALEGFVQAEKELTYRLHRNIAILCGEDVHGSETIYDNMRKISSLRNSIAHGAKADYKKIVEYLPYLKAVVSRVLIEIVLHNIQSEKVKNKKKKAVEVLDHKLTSLGFGDRKKISKDYSPMTLNLRNLIKVNWDKLV